MTTVRIESLPFHASRTINRKPAAADAVASSPTNIRPVVSR
jgi:hypothetical protein